jgi:hypothetical protein
MLNSISLRGWIRMHAAALLAAGMVMTAAAPPLAAQQEVVDTRLVIMNVRQTEEVLRVIEEHLAAFEPVALDRPTCEYLVDDTWDAMVGAVGLDPTRLLFDFIDSLVGGITSLEWRFCGRLYDFDIPGPVTSDYTIFIRENRMAVHAAGLPTMVWRVIPGSHSEMYFYDPETGEIQSFGGGNFENHFGGPLEIINLQDGDREFDERAPFDFYASGPTLLGPDGERLGYPVHRYEFGHQTTVRLPMIDGQPMMMTMFATPMTETYGEVWIARDTPYNTVVGGFFRNFAAHVDPGSDGMLGGLTGQMARLADLGVPMVTVDTATVTVSIPDTYESVIIEKSVTRSVVTDIRFGHYNVEELEGIFGPEPSSLEGTPDSHAGPEGGAGGDSCDCSCDAFREFQDLDENDPGAMAKAMCAQQCVSRWISCAGPGCSEL